MTGQTLAVARRILAELIRTRRSLVFWAIFPGLMLLLFGLIYAGKSGGTAASFDSTAPGILVGAALFFSCLGGPVTVLVAERERRTLRRLLASPLLPAAYFLGIALAFLAIAAGQTAMVYGLAYTFGGRFHGNLGLGALVALLCVFTYVGLGFFFGARLARRAEDVNGPVAAFGVPLLVLGGTFFPVSLLPGYLLKLAWLDPVFHMNQALKGVSALGWGWAESAPHLAVLGLSAAAALLLGVRSYRHLLAQEKQGRT
jgi:ABC-2 type transport system permease protein